MTTDLRAAAMSATPGPWRYHWPDHQGGLWPIEGTGWAIPVVGAASVQPNAAYIAAASPDRILALLDTNERQAARIAELEDYVTKWRDVLHALYHTPDDAAGRWTDRQYAEHRRACEAGMCSEYNDALAPGTGEARDLSVVQDSEGNRYETGMIVTGTGEAG